MAQQQKKDVLTISALAEHIGAELFGSGSGRVIGVNTVDRADAEEISFVTSEKLACKLAETRAAAVIVARRIENADITQLVVDNVEASIVKTLNLFAPQLTPIAGIHATAVIENSARIDDDAAIGAGAYIGHGVRIGAGSVISSGCRIGERTTVGSNCRLDGNVVVYHDCKIGNNCIIQANCTIGSTGFGYYFIDGGHKLIPHNGTVVIEDCVEIGANSCVDRAKFGNTVIGAGTKIDNLVQIGHNVEIGKCCLIASQVGIAGSCRIGNGVAMGGQVGIRDHLNIGDGVMIAAQSGLFRDVEAGRQIGGAPAHDIKDQMRIFGALKYLPEMAREFKKNAGKKGTVDS